MQVDSQRYDRLVIALTPVFITTQYAFFLVMDRVINWRPALTADAVKAITGSKTSEMTEAGWRSFHINAAQLVWSGFFHIAYGTAAIFAARGFVDDAPERSLGDQSALLAIGDIEYVQLQESAALLGSVFGALMMTYLWFWCIGWDKGLEPLFHHLTFFGVTLVLARESALPRSGTIAMAMEASSPALNAMNLLRQLDSPRMQSMSMAAFLLFLLLFCTLRIVFFGHVVLRTCYLRLFSPDGFPLHVATWKTDAVVILWLAGWLLQLYWMLAIFKKILRKLGLKKQKQT